MTTKQPTRTRTIKRRELTRQRREAERRGRSLLDFAGEHSTRLDMSPGGYAISNTRLNAVLAAIDRSGIGPYLERRLRHHPGRSCSYSPTMIAVGAVLSVMNGWTLEVTDITKALAGIHPLTRMDLGLQDDDGFFVGYRSVDHQFNRLTEALSEGWVDADGTVCNTQWFVDAVIDATVPEDAPTLEAASIDGLALQTWARMRWNLDIDDDPVASATVDTEAEAYDDRAEFTAPEALRGIDKPEGDMPKRATRKAKDAWPLSPIDNRPVPTADPDARLGKRTVTQSQPTKMYAGFEAHIASQVRTAHWDGDPRHITLGDPVPNYVRGLRLTRASEYRATAGTELVTTLKNQNPELAEVLADRGYTQLKAENFHDPIRDLGIKLVMDYKVTQLNKAVPYEVPTGRRNVRNNTNPTQRVWRTAGGIFHQYMPVELLENPALPWKRSEERARLEEHYNERAAYAYRIHSEGPGDTVRLSCPACAGRLRHVDPQVAAATDTLHLPPLDAPPGTTSCCIQRVITTTATDRTSHWQEIPYGTTAWARSYGRRALVENTNSVLRTGLARMARGFFRVFGKDKVELLLGLALGALNLKMAERTRRREEVEVVYHDWFEDNDEGSDADLDDPDIAEAPPPRAAAPPGAEHQPTTD